MTDQNGTQNGTDTPDEVELRHWGNMLYQNRVQNLSEFKGRMWTVMQWVVGLNIAANVSLLSGKYETYSFIIGFGAIFLVIFGSLFIVFLHCGTIRQRRRLEDVKERIGRLSEEFRHIEFGSTNSNGQRRRCCFNGWSVGFSQIALIVTTGSVAAMLALGDKPSLCGAIAPVAILILATLIVPSFLVDLLCRDN